MEPQILKLDVKADVFQLLADGDEFAAVAEAQAIETAELHHDVADLFQIAAFGGPEDQIQCVIEKMRIDLRLQDLYLAVFEVFAKIVLLLHQVPDPPDHDVEAVLQLTDLIGSLCDLTSGSGDKGTPVVFIQGYFDTYAEEK